VFVKPGFWHASLDESGILKYGIDGFLPFRVEAQAHQITAAECQILKKIVYLSMNFCSPL